jgi:hypothetical protein
VERRIEIGNDLVAIERFDVGQAPVGYVSQVDPVRILFEVDREKEVVVKDRHTIVMNEFVLKIVVGNQ